MILYSIMYIHIYMILYIYIYISIYTHVYIIYCNTYIILYNIYPHIYIYITHIYLGNPRQAMKSQVLLHGAVGTGPGRGHRRFEGRGWSGGEHNIYIYICIYVYIYMYCMYDQPFLDSKES